MASKFGPNQNDVLNIWASNSRAKAKAGRLRTEDGKLYSCNLLIGQITPGNKGEGGTMERLRVVFNYTTEGGYGISVTTTRHVNLAKRFAHLICPVNPSGKVDWTNPRLGPVVENWRMHVEMARMEERG